MTPVIYENLDVSGSLKCSPFHDYWVSRSTTNVWTRRGHLTVPAVLHDAMAETAAFGVAAAFADISDRTLWKIEGDESVAFLAALCGETENFFQPKAVRRVVWCDALGYARGTGHIALKSRDRAFLATAVRDLVWIQEASHAFDIKLSAPAAAGLRLAGPNTADVLAAGGIIWAGDCMMVVPGVGQVLALSPVEGAMDLWCEPDQAMALAWLLERAGARPAGADAMNAWRLSKGFLSAGRDWIPSQSATRSSQLRKRQDLVAGGYSPASWETRPAADLEAVFWPALGQFLAILWTSGEGAHAPSAPSGGTIFGSVATD
jgi:glycine cleavage system aminomethyltransferase T